jgi:ParB family transcriptional regulator, chromosome partitioning protein
MSKKLAAKAGLILGLPVATGGPTQAAKVEPDANRAKTAPGSMLQFMSTQSAAIKEADELRERLKDFDGATPVRMLDPATIRASKWANRHATSFDSADFAELKDEIESAGGNVQPIRVRPLLNGSTPAEDGVEYELVFGHRRHRACLELEMPVRALIEPATDQELFEAMERENRGRKNLSAWEQGCMYRKALDEGLYTSLRKLAEAVKVDVSLVSKSVALARLPEVVVAAFPTPLDIQFRWAQPLGEVLQRDPDAMLARAKAIIGAPQQLAALQVFEALTRPASAAEQAPAPVVTSLGKSARKRVTLTQDAKGGLQLKFAPGVIDQERQRSLIKLIEEFLAE